MTKQELIKMTGSEEQADYAMEILLRNCKKGIRKDGDPGGTERDRKGGQSI